MRYTFFLGLLSLLSSCATPTFTAGEPLPGIDLSAVRDNIILSWATDAPIAASLGSRGRIDIVAQYPTENGIVTGEAVAIGSALGSNRMQFVLPRQLRNLPTGSVCLRLRMINGRALPIRVAGGEDSVDGFYYPHWEQQVSREIRGSRLNLRGSELSVIIGQAGAELDNFESWRRQQNLADARSCELIEDASVMERPASALEPSEWDMAARRDCVWRYKKTFPPSTISEMSYLYTHYLGEEKGKGAAAKADELARLEARYEQVEELEQDYQRFDQETGLAYEGLTAPRPLPLTSVAQYLRSEYSQGGDMSQALASGILTSYQSCLADAQAQFELSLDTWTREQDPRLATGRSEIRKQECRVRFAAGEELKNTVANLNTDLSEINEELATLARSDFSQLPDLLPLNGYSCSAY